MKGVDLLLSATTSPHYTISARELAAVEGITPACWPTWLSPGHRARRGGAARRDPLQRGAPLGVDTRREVPAAAAEMVDGAWSRWPSGRTTAPACPAWSGGEAAVAARVLSTRSGRPGGRGPRWSWPWGGRWTSYSGALKENLTPEELERCARQIEVHTAAKPRWPLPEQRPLRFPLFVNLAGEKAVVVGGGAVACRRAEVLSRFGAEVTVIAPRCKTPPQGIQWEGRPYAPGDRPGRPWQWPPLTTAPSTGRWGRRPARWGSGQRGRLPGGVHLLFPRRLYRRESGGRGHRPGRRPRPHRPGGPGHPQRIGGIGMKTVRSAAGRAGWRWCSPSW